MSWATRTFPCPQHGEQPIRGMGAEQITLRCGAVGSDGQYAHEGPEPLPCCKCGAPTVVASVDLNASVCFDCVTVFDDWADSHPHEPFANFIHPKPWDMGRKV